MKVYKCQWEEHAGALVDKVVAMQRMARLAAMAYNRFQQGQDGRTPFQRQTGRVCRSEVVPFGERVRNRESKKSGERKNIMDIKWKDGK